ncbi:MAG: ATP-binding cassette domain-containing protein [Planctomycetota bacterium]
MSRAPNAAPGGRAPIRQSPMIRVEALEKRFGQTLAVAGISFEVGRGEVVGFLGPNGAGKTTTIRVLTCFHPATRGRAEVAGFDVQKHPLEVRRRIGYLPENVPIYPDLRVEEYLDYRAALKGVPRRLRRAAVLAAMERCGVVDVRRKLVGHVSRGYRQRVGLADALVANPPILVLDEPTSGLDPNQRRRMKQLVRDLASEHTILFSSHVLGEVQDVSSRILLIHEGRIRADGTPARLLADCEGRRIVVEARASAGALAAALGPLAERGAVEALEDGYARFTAGVAPDEDPRDQVAERCAASGLALRELRLCLPSLEDYFQRVTEGDEREDPASEDPEEEP